MKKTQTLQLAAAASALISGAVMAAPMDPNDDNAYRYFPASVSAELESKYYLYTDSHKKDLIWYVPKTGYVAYRGSGQNTRPNFNATRYVPQFGIWAALRAGESQIRMGGSFNTMGRLEDVNFLKTEAEKVGFSVSPAVVKRGTASLIVDGIDVDADGRVDVQCESYPLTMTDQFGNQYTANIQNCSVTAVDGRQYPATVIERAYAKVPSGRTSASVNIPFQLMTLPNNEMSNLIEQDLAVGSSLAPYFSLVVDWELETERETRVARVTVDWNQTFEQAHAFAAYHNYACVDIELQSFFKKLVQEGKGVYVEYYNPETRQYETKAPNQAAFIRAVEGVRADLQAELFDQIREYSQSQLGLVDTRTNAMWTLRANYEKQVLKRHETRMINWNPGMSMEAVQTEMSVDCVQGGFGTPVAWSTDTGCHAIVDDWTTP
ncbi:hypothetical protein KDD30_07155 [Photobacterium sp. GJ3]|uniref:hypothetical protein n=1 Tax=Photobacterium sp. GJ3 TaxID=2829502 RepID=UPI001B8A9901|nr:hypothetical protein [Photobacterium sp. GJ3]QUJ68853.1 hypothetical protein KDD30_07155 [Photobacterium sp. GJ3]